MCYVDQRHQAVKTTLSLPISLQAAFSVIAKRIVQITKDRKQRKSLKHLNEHLLKDIGYSDADIYSLKSQRHLIGSFPSDFHGEFRR